MQASAPSPSATPWLFFRRGCDLDRSGDALLLRRHRTGALIDRHRSQLEMVGVGILGLPGRAAATIKIDEQLAGIGLIAQRARRVVLAVEQARAEQGSELSLVEALDAIEGNRCAGVA